MTGIEYPTGLQAVGQAAPQPGLRRFIEIYRDIPAHYDIEFPVKRPV